MIQKVAGEKHIEARVRHLCTPTDSCQDFSASRMMIFLQKKKVESTYTIEHSQLFAHFDSAIVFLNWQKLSVNLFVLGKSVWEQRWRCV